VYDAVIHNAGIGYSLPRAGDTEDGFERVFAVNVLAPYVVTALMKRPSRLVYLSSGLHTGGSPDLDDAQRVSRRWNGSQAYADSKLFDIMLAFGVARRWPKVLSNAVDPGWVKTKMGGSGAPDGLEIGATTQAWLAASDDAEAKVTGEYFYHKKPRRMKAEAKRIKAYIQPEHGTTEIALMYLPSETLYMEAVRNRDLADWLNQQHVFPVSPNTLLMTLQTIALVHKWYEVASKFEKSRQELAKAQKSFDHFQNQFENVGKSLDKAQEAFDKATTHLKTYRGRVSALSGQEQLELDKASSENLPLIDKASA